VACGLWLTGVTLAATSSWLSHHAESLFEARLRRQLAAHLVRLPASTLSRYSGDALRRLVSDDISALHHMTAHLPAEFATLIVVPAVTIAVLVASAGPVALLALAPGIVAALFYLFVIPRMAARHSAESADVMGDIATAVDDYARGIHVCRIYGAQTGAAADYAESTARFTRGMQERVRLVATPAALAVALMQATATFAIAYTVGYRWDATTLAATILFSLAIVTPALRLGHGLDYVAAGRAAAVRLAAALDEPTLPAGEALTVPASSPSDRLEIVDLTVMIADRRVVDGVTHAFRPAAITAITGPSGAGKSTLLKALAGFEIPELGTVRYAGQSVLTIDENLRPQSILLTPQGADVLPATVRENIALAAPDTTDAEYNAALRRAQIDISLDTDATSLSGGERQRVGLARVFLSPAAVLLLDEPTSALDDRTAAELLKELRDFAHAEGKTIVIVTHDPALADDADDRLDLDSPNSHNAATRNAALTGAE
ncbi:ABC transporter, partial [Rhodococcus erythropolis]